MLAKGMVPTEPIVAAVERAFPGITWVDSDFELQPLTRMWPIQDFKKMFVAYEWVPFNLADQALCLLGLSPNIWWDELPDIYYKVNLEIEPPREGRLRKVPKGHARCARSGCSEVFPKITPRGREQKYCSRGCKGAASKARLRGERTQKNRAYDICPAGHDRSPENTMTVHHKSGQVENRCRICENTAKRERRAQKRLQEAA